MIKLKEAPMFCEFFKRIIELDNTISFDFDIGEELSIEGMCRCTDQDCATVHLKRDKNWKEEILGSYILNTPSLIILHLYENGWIEFEALNYKYPYKSEIHRVLAGKKTYKLTKNKIAQIEKYLAQTKNKIKIINLKETDSIRWGSEG